jgi:hypothetical protein
VAQCNEALCVVFIKAPIILYIARATPTNLLYVSSDSLLLLCIRLPRARYENAPVQIYALQRLLYSFGYKQFYMFNCVVSGEILRSAGETYDGSSAGNFYNF